MKMSFDGLSTRGDNISESLAERSGMSKHGGFTVAVVLGRGLVQLIILQSWPSRKNPPSPEKSLFEDNPAKKSTIINNNYYYFQPLWWGKYSSSIHQD